MGFLYAIGAAIIWGLVYVVNGRVLETTPPLILLFLGAVTTAVITFPVLIIRWESVKELVGSSKSTLMLIVLGEVLFVFANFLIFSSIKNLGAPLAATIEISYPFFVALFTLLIFGGTFNVWFWVGASLIFAGSFVIIKMV